MKISRKGGGINKKSGIRKPHPKHVGPKKKINKPKSNNKNKSKMEVELKKNIPEIQKPEKPPNKSKLITSQHLSPSEHRSYFIHQFESANDTKLSSLELESIQGSLLLPSTCYACIFVHFVCFDEFEFVGWELRWL